MHNVTPPTITQAPQGVFVSSLACMDRGKVLEQLDEALRDVTNAVNHHQLKGAVTLKIVVVPNGVGAGGTPLVIFDEEITTKIPKPKRKNKSVFFVDEHGNPCRREPKQDEMVLTTIDGAEGPALKPLGVAAAAAANS